MSDTNPNNENPNLDNTTTQDNNNPATNDVSNPEEEYHNNGESLFYVKKPKDVTEGLGQGVGNILKGIHLMLQFYYYY